MISTNHRVRVFYRFKILRLLRGIRSRIGLLYQKPYHCGFCAFSGGSSEFVFVPPHGKGTCPNHRGATMMTVGMGYDGAKTNPGVVRNIVVGHCVATLVSPVQSMLIGDTV